MKIFIVRTILSDWDGEWITNESVFSSEESALLRIQKLSKEHPDLSYDIEEFIVDELQ